MELTCPDCHALLTVQSDSVHCPSCQHHFKLCAYCPDCQQPLEVLKACGATDYFCQNGHSMISKKRVIFRLT